MVAAAVVRTGHLAVTGVEVAAVTEGEAVGRVGAEEVRALSLELGILRIIGISNTLS